MAVSSYRFNGKSVLSMLDLLAIDRIVKVQWVDKVTRTTSNLPVLKRR